MTTHQSTSSGAATSQPSCSAQQVRLGITGGIGSGKSHVSRLLQEHWQVPVYDCDSEAKRLTASLPSIREALTRLVGEALWQDGQLQKPLLAAYLFASPDHARQVNAIIHPAVRQDFLRWARQHAASPVVAIESAILCESGFDSLVDCIMLVDAPQDVRLRRAMTRDGASREQVQARMAQQDSTQARAKARFVVNNGDASPDNLVAQLQAVVDALRAGHQAT